MEAAKRKEAEKRRELARKNLEETENRIAELDRREKEAARRILQVSSELHLTWASFERVLRLVKEMGVID